MWNNTLSSFASFAFLSELSALYWCLLWKLPTCSLSILKREAKEGILKEKKKAINLESLIEQNININFNFSLRAAGECPYKGWKMFLKIALTSDKVVEVQLSLEYFSCHRCFGFRKVFELVFFQGLSYCCLLHLLLAWCCQRGRQCRGREVMLLISKQHISLGFV